MDKTKSGFTRQKSIRFSGGFTIVELLIVIVVIGILAAITIVAYNGIQIRSQAAAIISDLKATDKAFNAYKVSTGADVWWVDSDAALTGVGNPSLTSIIAAQPSFRDFVQKSPATGGLGTATGWFYDSDNDTYNGCSASLNGVNLAIVNPTNTALMQTIDSTLDDGNLSCGKVRISGAYFLYGIANSP